MPLGRCVVLVCFAAVLLVAAPAFAQMPSAPAADQVALLPEAGTDPPPASAAAQPPPAEPAANNAAAASEKAPASAASAPQAKAEQQLQLAQLPDSEVALTFADLIELARDYLEADFPEQAQRYFEQALSLAPTSADAGLVENLRLWAFVEQHRDGEVVLADAEPVVQTEVARICQRYQEPETQAFAQLLLQTFEAWRAGNRNAFADICQRTADTWQGTYLGAWAQMRVGYLYGVDGKWEYEPAREAYLKAARDYAGTPVEAEALAYLAECLIWQVGTDEAIQEGRDLLEQAQQAGPSERVYLGILVTQWGLALSAEGPAKAMSLCAEMMAKYPSSPWAYWARWDHLTIAKDSGLWEVAVEDAEVLLSGPQSSDPEPIFGAHEALGSDAFRNGRYQEAEQEFTLALEVAEGKVMPVTDETGQGLRHRALAGIAICRSAQGDLKGAVDYFLQAADAVAEAGARDAALHLYRAAIAADQLGDRGAVNQITARMVAEFPGSYLTTRLVGHEVLPPPDI